MLREQHKTKVLVHLFIVLTGASTVRDITRSLFILSKISSTVGGVAKENIKHK